MQEEQCHTLRLRSPNGTNNRILMIIYTTNKTALLRVSRAYIAVCENVCGEEFSCTVIRCRSL